MDTATALPAGFLNTALHVNLWSTRHPVDCCNLAMRACSKAVVQNIHNDQIVWNSYLALYSVDLKYCLVKDTNMGLILQ